MNDEKFTPGEWHIWKDNSTIPFVFNEDGYAVACMCGKQHNDIKTVGCIQDYLFPNEVLANAHLIAAAPEMYRMLKRQCNICKLKDHEIECEMCEINRVLKKAKGE